MNVIMKTFSILCQSFLLSLQKIPWKLTYLFICSDEQCWQSPWLWKLSPYYVKCSSKYLLPDCWTKPPQLQDAFVVHVFWKTLRGWLRFNFFPVDSMTRTSMAAWPQTHQDVPPRLKSPLCLQASLNQLDSKNEVRIYWAFRTNAYPKEIYTWCLP